MKNVGDIITFLKKKDYEMVNNNLGSGAFGKTVLLRDPFIDELFVAKKYEPFRPDLQKDFYDSFLREIKIMHKLNHQNIVRIYNYYAYESLFTGYILMEYIDGTNIDDYLMNYVPWDSVTSPEELFIQLIDGFCYLEEHGIVHRDIREGNILINKDGVAKIIDFGLGKTFQPVDANEDSLNEIINRSGLDSLPQEYFDGKYSSKTDMFYLAELFNRLLRKHGKQDLFPRREILHKMMEYDPDNRYESFSSVRDAMRKDILSTLSINERDKEIYQAFSEALCGIIANYNESPQYISTKEQFISGLRQVLLENCFEDQVQNVTKLVRTIVTSSYAFYRNSIVPCYVLEDFVGWFEKHDDPLQERIFINLISKLSKIKVVAVDDIPF